MDFNFQPPDLAEFPRRSYRKFLEKTLGSLFEEISPIVSEGTGRYEISFIGANNTVNYRFEEFAKDSGYPQSSEEARKTNMTYAKRFLIDVWLKDNFTGEIRKSVMYMGDMPVITDRGTFVINGSERVVLGQLVRAPGIYFECLNSLEYKALMLAEKGAPVTFELHLDSGTGKVNRSKCRIKLPKRGFVNATTVLFALGFDESTIEKRIGNLLTRNNIEWPRLSRNDALTILGKAWRNDGSGGQQAGLTALQELTDRRRYTLSELGRRRLNKKLNRESDNLQLDPEDILAAVEYLLGLPLGIGSCDQIDSLENRHLKGVGSHLTRQLRPALALLAKSIKSRLELTQDDDVGSPLEFVDNRAFISAMSKFFASNPLVQYLDQQNPLSELAHRRRITSFGPGGIDPSAAPTSMRDVHPSQIGRVCLVESPEGKNCGMVSYLASFCRIDDDGFMTVPYRKVNQGIVTNEVVYLSPAEDKLYTLAPPDTKVDGNRILGPLVSVRQGENFYEVTPDNVDMIGITPQGFLSVGSGLIPFLEHDDANRALMGGGMMRQTLPLVRPERPRVGTGMEKVVAASSGHSVIAKRSGIVSKVEGSAITIKQASGEHRVYNLIRFDRTNQNTILDQKPSVVVGQKVEAGQIIADGPASCAGELSLGRNLLVAFMPWRGYNFEDAIILRKGLVKDQKLTHIEIEKHSIGVHQTLRGPEILTPELPNISQSDLEHLDERGIAKIGSFVEPGAILVAKLAPKEQRALSAEEELLQAVFGKVAEEMTDTSLRLPHGSYGKVIDVRIFTPETTPELKAGLICEIEVLVARMCPVEVGDKLAGRHGNKGIVSIIVDDEDMPFLPDGTPVDIILNPLGVPSRMNVGQVFDAQLGLYSSILNRYYRIHQFDESISPDASYNLVQEALAQVRKLPNYKWLDEDGKTIVYDGRTGEPFDRPVLIGRQYMVKLNQLVLHKVNARSGLGGPYAAVTQQPVGGKANHGGQRVGEMEVWAIQAYGCANLLNEMMTIKADDIAGRHQAYADMVKGNNVDPNGKSAAFDALCCELKGLGLDLTLGQKVRGNTQKTHKTIKKDSTNVENTIEITAGEFNNSHIEHIQPVIKSMTVGKKGKANKFEYAPQYKEEIDFPSFTELSTLAYEIANVEQEHKMQLEALINSQFDFLADDDNATSQAVLRDSDNE